MDRGALEAVRHLVARFPRARLREVPLVRAFDLDGTADPTGATRVWLALEMLQVTGSFKVRGALVALDARRRRARFVVAGAGNHALGVAYAARVLGVHAIVCVPREGRRSERARVERYGPELIVAPPVQAGMLEGFAREVATARDAEFVPAHGDADVVRGNGTSLGFEIVRALGGVPERVLAPIGHGALATGLAWALDLESEHTAHLGPRVWGVRRETAPGAWPSVDARPPTSAALVGIAGVLAVTGAEVETAAAHAERDLGLVLERRAAAALAPVLLGLPAAVRGGDVVVVLTGRNVGQGRTSAAPTLAEDPGG